MKSLTKRTWLVILFLIVATGVIEYLMGRSWWCPAGDLALWSSNVNSIHNSQHLADPYSLTHIEHGFIFFFFIWLAARKREWSFRTKLIAATAIESIWEIIENSSVIINRFRESTLSLGYYGDSIANSLGDIGFMLFGFWLASKFSAKYSVAIVIALEILCFVWIHDNLLLNIIMLISPDLAATIAG